MRTGNKPNKEKQETKQTRNISYMIIGLHDIGKNSNIAIFFFLQYILRYEEKNKKKNMILISLFGKKINDWGDFIGE